MKSLIFVSVLALAACGGGGGSGSSQPTIPQYNFSLDENYRVNNHAEAVEVPCPTRNYETWLVSGQSNASSHAEFPPAFTSPSNVIQFWGGLCYSITPELLGTSAGSTTGFVKETFNPFVQVAAEYSSHTGKTVVLAGYAVGGRSIDYWFNGDFTDTFFSEVQVLSQTLGINKFLWQQGETDAINNMPTLEYLDKFQSIVERMAEQGFYGSVHVAQSSRCTYVPEQNTIAEAQQILRQIYPGPNTDSLINYRYDECHFSSQGVMEFSKAWLPHLK